MDRPKMSSSSSSFLSTTEARLPPGFRFHPRDEELVCDYLEKKVRRSADGSSGGGAGSFSMLIDIDLNKCEPWDLPAAACVGGKEWYFYSLRDRKYATGQRTNRATRSGYWKATGKDRAVRRRGALVGMRKTLVFYRGRAPKGRKTGWVMHEFRMESSSSSSSFLSPLQEDWVLCRVFDKTRGGGGGGEDGGGGAAASEANPAMETSSYDEVTTNSTSLPPLMDTFITVDPSSFDGNEQVPCFSDLLLPRSLGLQGIPLPEGSSIRGGMSEQVGGGGLPELGSCDEKVVKLVLDHFTKIKGNSNTEFPPDLESSYLSDNGLSQMWNTFYLQQQ